MARAGARFAARCNTHSLRKRATPHACIVVAPACSDSRRCRAFSRPAKAFFNQGVFSAARESGTLLPRLSTRSPLLHVHTTHDTPQAFWRWTLITVAWRAQQLLQLLLH